MKIRRSAKIVITEFDDGEFDYYVEIHSDDDKIDASEPVDSAAIDCMRTLNDIFCANDSVTLQ